MRALWSATLCKETIKGSQVYNSLKKYGESKFLIKVIDSGKCREELNAKEIFHISKLGTFVPNGYNLTRGGDTHEIAEETRKKLSIARSTWTLSKEAREKISLACLGRRHTEEAKKKIAEAGKGRIFSKETREKMRIARKNRAPVSDESRDRMSKSAKNRPPISEETRKKMSQSQLGKKHRVGNTCHRGHPYDQINTYINPLGQRACLTCHYLSKGKIPERLQKYATIIHRTST